MLFGIGIALIIERNNALRAWLVLGGLNLPIRGLVFLWVLFVVLVGISAVEIISGIKRRGGGQAGAAKKP